MKIKTKLLSSFIGLVIGCELMTATQLLFSTFKRIKNHILEITQLKIEQINSQVLSFLKPPVDAINATINFLDFCDIYFNHISPIVTIIAVLPLFVK